MDHQTIYYEPLKYIVPAEEEGWTVKDIMRRRMGISRKHLSRLKQTDGVKLNGKSVYVSVPVVAGDQVSAQMEAEESDDILAEPMPIRVLYEDEDVLIIDKPSGLIVHPTHGHYTGTIANGVIHYWQSKGEKHRFRPVHRLDQETSGVLLIAKNKHAHHVLSEQWQQQKVNKYYRAIVHGRLLLQEGTINVPIDRNPEDPKRRIVTADGYPSVTHYMVEQQWQDGALVRIELETGRTHQIRVHMQAIGHPLIGDTFYGEGLETYGVTRHALHAYRLQFFHPRSGQLMDMESAMPDDILELMERLEKGESKG